MKNCDRILAVLNYQEYDRLPIMHFGYWTETLVKWAQEGHIEMDDALNWNDATPACTRISDKLGFDCAWFNVFPDFLLLNPLFETKTLKENPDGSKEIMNHDGVVVLQKEDTVSIPAEIEHTLKDRASWESFYKPKLEFTQEVVHKSMVNTGL